MSTEAKIILGANYGDEGKGLATHYFAGRAHAENKKCLNILFNGGAQRGHTVEFKNGARHVFHHFGAGTFDGADTHFDSVFMVNPVMFVKEYEELQKKFGITPTCYISPLCKVTTPLDMLLNQLKEDARGDQRHGSCGMGIYETRKRYEDSTYALDYSDLYFLSHEERIAYFNDMLKGYSREKLAELGCDISLKEHRDVIIHFVDDLEYMMSIVKMKGYRGNLEGYDVVLFEGAQGLALSEDAKAGFPHLTPSKTTSERPFEIIAETGIKNVEVCYVTRSYLTRHGAGSLPGECSKEAINKDIEDLTNAPNDYQGSIRYARLRENSLFRRIEEDTAHYCTAEEETTVSRSLMVTHLNYENAYDLIQNHHNYFNKIYLSDSKYAEDIAIGMFNQPDNKKFVVA